MCNNLHTTNAPGSWMAVDLRGARVRPSAYVLGARADHSSHYPQSRVLEGSNDGEAWEVIAAHTRDETLSDNRRAGRWAVACPANAPATRVLPVESEAIVIQL